VKKDNKLTKEWAIKIVSEFNLIIQPQNLSIALDRIFPLPLTFFVFTNMKYRIYQLK